MSIGLIGRKAGMTQVFAPDGTMVAVSVLEVAPNVVTRLRTPERDGYYRVTWLTEDAFPNRPPQPIRAETTVWVTTSTTTELGYRHGGVEIIADKDTFRVGQRAPVMLVANSNDRYVLFTVEAEELISYQIVHLTGTVKLVELIDEAVERGWFMSIAGPVTFPKNIAWVPAGS